MGLGRALPGRDRYDVIYTGAPRAFEAVQYGHELTHVLTYYLVPEGAQMLAFLSEGVAEYLDQSGRDYHESYAEQLTAGEETRAHVASFDSYDVRGDNYGRASSFVKAFVEVAGLDALPALIGATAVRRDHGCYLHADYGCIDSPDALEELFAGVIPEVSDSTWEEVQAYWRTTVEDILAYRTVEVEGRDRTEIQWLLRRADQAIEDSDAAAYRATMEGFYCDWAGEDGRVAIAERMVDTLDQADTSVVAVYPTLRSNFPTAKAVVVRSDADGGRSTFAVWLEQFPVGWRITWMEEWR